MTGTLERRGARIATLVAGGLVAALALAATTTATLVGLGTADASQRGYVLPEGITAIEVHSTSLRVAVHSADGRDADPATAFIRGIGSTAFGELPGLDIEVVGTTAIITPDESKRQLAPTPYALDIQLNGLVLDSIDVEAVEDAVHIDAAAKHMRAASQQSSVYLRVPVAGIVEHVEAEGGSMTQIVLPESGVPYDVLLPEWFDEDYLTEWWQAHYGLDYRTEVLEGTSPAPTSVEPPSVAPHPTPTPIVPINISPLDGPGVFIPTAPDAPVTIDLRGVNGGMIQVHSPESLDRGGRG